MDVEVLERAITSHDAREDGYDHVLMHPDLRRMLDTKIAHDHLPYSPKTATVLYYCGHRISASKVMPLSMLRFFSPDKPFAKNVNLEVQRG